MYFFRKVLKSIRKNLYAYIGILLFLLVCAVAAVSVASTAPTDFPGNQIISVKKNSYLSEVANSFSDENIVRSPFLFKAYVVLLGGGNKIIAGDYLFSKSQSALKVAYRVVNGIQDLPKIKVTIPEGSSVKTISSILASKIQGFPNSTFINSAQKYEGYLYPDTYYFYNNSNIDQIITAMRDNFTNETTLLRNQSLSFGKSFDDVIKMASIVEKEATSTTDRKIIAGILWKRIDIGMPLQVDPPFYYILGKISGGLTLNDLAVNSPYNLYTHKGLPPTPISNPGLDAIKATLSPTVTNYWFYLSDKKGVMHYAVDHDNHIANKNKYLR